MMSMKGEFFGMD